MTPAPSFLDALKAVADEAGRAEEAFRREIAERTKSLERDRAFANRRLNFMRAIAEAVATAEDEAAAAAAGTATLQARLGWAGDSDARRAVAENFAPVVREVFASLEQQEDDRRPDVVAALTAFESWYRETHPHPFWELFEHYMPETPRVDF